MSDDALNMIVAAFVFFIVLGLNAPIWAVFTVSWFTFLLLRR